MLKMRKIKAGLRDAYRLGSLQIDDALYPECMPSGITNEDEFRDPVYCAIVSEQS